MLNHYNLNLLSEEGLQKIHNKTMTLLEQTGVKVLNHPDACQMLKDNGCTVEGDQRHL